MSHFFLNVCRPSVNYFQTALAKVEALGFTAQDVRHIVLTHLDFDHAGGLDDFPEATVHVMRAEKRAAEYRRGFIPSRRYRPLQYRHHSLWKTYRPQGERWYGFEAVRSLEGLPPEILMVPLAGHTLGHAGVAVRSCGTDGADWLLHAGDAYFYRGEIKPEHPHCTPGLALYQWMMDTRRDWRIGNQKRLRALVRAHGDEIRVFCAHDQKEFEQLSGFATSGAQRQAA